MSFIGLLKSQAISIKAQDCTLAVLRSGNSCRAGNTELPVLVSDSARFPTEISQNQNASTKVKFLSKSGHPSSSTSEEKHFLLRRKLECRCFAMVMAKQAFTQRRPLNPDSCLSRPERFRSKRKMFLLHDESFEEKVLMPK